jgi:hypothetical protein
MKTINRRERQQQMIERQQQMEEDEEIMRRIIEINIERNIKRKKERDANDMRYKIEVMP